MLNTVNTIYNGIPLLCSCIPHHPKKNAADRELQAEPVKKMDTDSDSDKSDDEKDLAV